MSVLRCSRGDCENIMCDRFSSTYGYICHSCFEELVNSGQPIAKFMNSQVGYYKSERSRDLYDLEFPMDRS